MVKAEFATEVFIQLFILILREAGASEVSASQKTHAVENWIWLTHRKHSDTIAAGMLERWRGLFKGNSKILSTSGRLFEKLEKRSWKFRLSGSVLAFPKTSLLETCLISFGTLHKFCQSGGKWRGYWKNLVHRIESVVVAVYETL